MTVAVLIGIIGSAVSSAGAFPVLKGADSESVIIHIADLLAADPGSSVFGIVSFAWAGFGAAFGPAILFALFWKHSCREGILAGMLTGETMAFVWKFLIRPLVGIWGICELLPAFLASCAVCAAVSLAAGGPEPEVLRGFEEYRKK